MNNYYKQIDPSSILLIFFIILKLTGSVDWSWWMVLSPLWIWGIVVIILILMLLWAKLWRK